MQVVWLVNAWLYTASSCAPPAGWKAQSFHFSTSAYLLISSVGDFDSFMQKEIFEQPETVVNTMRGRICFDSNTGDQTVPDQALKVHRGTAGINYFFFTNSR